MQDVVGVNVRVSPARACSAVADDLAAAGLQVERVLASLHVVSGTVAADCVDRLSSVDGVTAVERDRPVSPSAAHR